VVIPSYNMAWCLARAVESCRSQSCAELEEIIVVDDCSTDKTQLLVGDMQSSDARIRYVRRSQRGGHLAALSTGINTARSDWIALFDADDELSPASLENRISAADKYHAETGVVPQLVYGDLDVMRFPRLKGYVFPFVCRELCLCQTSTMMLGRAAIAHFPVEAGWNTDDHIVVSIAKYFHVLHAGCVVAKYCRHESTSRMSNNRKKVFEGVYELVRHCKDDILHIHGVRGLMLWTCACSGHF